MTSPIPSFAHLSDDELLATVQRLATTECRATAALVRSLMELDVRRLYLGQGYSSLFTYCTQALHLAEGAAYNRIEAARAARRFPAVLAALEEGSVTLTTVRLLAPHLTAANHQNVLALARRKGEPDRYKLQFTISRETHAKLRRVQALGRNVIPSGDPAAIFDRALTLLLQDLERRRCAAVTSLRGARDGGRIQAHPRVSEARGLAAR